MNSFMSWIGGKKALRDEIIARFPLDYSRYIEVFGGGGWVLFHKAPERDFEVYNDFNPNLANLYSTQSVGEKMTEEERATHRPGPDRRNRTDMTFSPRKPGRKPKAETDDDDDADKGDSMPMAQSNIPAGEETEIIINEKGDIVDERIRNDLPR